MAPRVGIDVDLKKVEEYAQICDSEEEIAIALGISYRTLQRRKKDFVEFGEAIKRGKAKANIFVGGKLMQKIRDGDTASTIFYLKSRCGWREVNRTEVTGKDGGPVSQNVVQGMSNEQLLAIARLEVGDEESKS